MSFAYAALKRRSSTVAHAVMVAYAVTVVHAVTVVSPGNLLLVFFSALFFRVFGEDLCIGCWIQFDLFEFGGACGLSVPFVLVLAGHGQAVFGAPVFEIGLAFEGAGLSDSFVSLAENVAGLG